MVIKAILSASEFDAAVELFETLDSNSPEAHALHNQIERYQAECAKSVRRQLAARSAAMQAAAAAAYGNL